MKIFALPYKRGSKSCKRIAQGVGARLIKLVRSRFKPASNKIVINWGHTQPPINLGDKVLNKSNNIVTAVNKAAALIFLQEAGVRVPRFTCDRAIAKEWFDESPETVVFCRTLLRSSGGKGIVIAKSPEEVVRAPLYTKRVKKVDEYRVHVFQGEAIDVAHKRLRNGLANQANRNAFVRNFENGWIHAHENVKCPDEVKELAIKAVSVLGLDFGAVDIGVTKKGLPFVFEVNTAPGLENQQTISAYISAFNNYKKKEEEKQNEKINHRNFWR